MKKKIIIIVLFFIIIGFAIKLIDNKLLFSKSNVIEKKSTNATKNELYSIKNEITIETQKEIKNEVFEFILSKDTEKLKEFFIPNIRNRDTLSLQLEELLKFIDGDIISYSEIIQGTSSKSKEYFTTTFENNTYKITDVKTNTGKSYIIYYSITEIDKENPNNLGLNYIGIFDNDLYDTNNGYPYSGKYIINEESTIIETANSKHIPQNLLNSILNKDKEKIKSFMPKNLQELPETDMQINEFFNFIDGDIISYSNPKSEIKFNSNNSITFEGIISNIKTNEGKNYEINFEYTDELGIYNIILMNSDTYDKRKGIPISERVYIGNIFYAYNNKL